MSLALAAVIGIYTDKESIHNSIRICIRISICGRKRHFISKFQKRLSSGKEKSVCINILFQAIRCLFFTPPRNRGGVYFHCSLSVCDCVSISLFVCLSVSDERIKGQSGSKFIFSSQFFVNYPKVYLSSCVFVGG